MAGKPGVLKFAAGGHRAFFEARFLAVLAFVEYRRFFDGVAPRRRLPHQDADAMPSPYDSAAIAARRASGAAGLTRYASKPASKARRRSSGCPYPVSATRRG